MKRVKARSFEDARKFVRSLKLESFDEYRKYCKSGKKPADIPTAPNTVYENKGWRSVGDWLGTGRIGNLVKSQSYLSPQKAAPIIRKLAKQYGLKNKADWTRFAKTHKKLLQKLHLPADLVRIYSLKRAKKRMKK